MIEVLFVCTANMCRSPMAEGIAAALLAERGMAVEVSSCGIRTDGSPAAGRAVELMARRGIDLTEHLSTPLTAERLARADLVVAMSRRHAREVFLVEPAALGRTFTLRELIRRATEAGPCPTGTSFAGWLHSLSVDRSPEMLLGASSRDDIADPYGQGTSAYQAVIAELDELIVALVDLLAPAFQETTP